MRWSAITCTPYYAIKHYLGRPHPSSSEHHSRSFPSLSSQRPYWLESDGSSDPKWDFNARISFVCPGKPISLQPLVSHLTPSIFNGFFFRNTIRELSNNGGGVIKRDEGKNKLKWEIDFFCSPSPLKYSTTRPTHFSRIHFNSNEVGGGVGGGGRRSRDIILHVVLYSVCFISLFNIFSFFFLKKGGWFLYVRYNARY